MRLSSLLLCLELVGNCFGAEAHSAPRPQGTAREVEAKNLARNNRVDEGVQYETAWALGRMGPDAVPAMLELLKDEDPHVRCLAAWALKNIGPQAKAAIPAL